MLMSCVAVVSVIIWLFNSPQPHLKNIVSKTQLHIKSINSKLDSGSRRRLDSVDSTYLELLGFIKNPRLFDTNTTSFPKSGDDKLDGNSEQALDPIRPPLVSAFLRFGEKERALIESKLKFFASDLFLIYDLDLSSSEHLKVEIIFSSK